LFGNNHSSASAVAPKPTLLPGLLRPVPPRYLISGGLDHCIKVWNPLLTKVRSGSRERL
jgi:hypothetical protein